MPLNHASFPFHCLFHCPAIQKVSKLQKKKKIKKNNIASDKQIKNNFDFARPQTALVIEEVENFFARLLIPLSSVTIFGGTQPLEALSLSFFLGLFTRSGTQENNNHQSLDTLRS